MGARMITHNAQRRTTEDREEGRADRGFPATP